MAGKNPPKRNNEHLETIKKLCEHFEPEAIHSVPGPGGKNYDYAKAHYVIKRLIDVFGLSWSATTIATPVINTDPMSNKQWITMGVRFAIEMDGKVWEKDGWDSVEIKTYSYGEKQGHWIDLGNNFKQAYSQALKKAVTQIGIALYLYFGEGGLPDELDPMPDNLITFSNNELPPSSPSWGAGAIDPPEEINRSFQEVPQYKEERGRINKLIW